jgi:hypothetical protein
MKEISEKKFYWKLEVLPPLLMGKDMVKCFLSYFDENIEIVNDINTKEFTDLFIQGEGWDKHEIYGVTKDGKYYYLGETKKQWETENFRYDDTGNFMPKKIEDKLKCEVN